MTKHNALDTLTAVLAAVGPSPAMRALARDPRGLLDGTTDVLLAAGMDPALVAAAQEYATLQVRDDADGQVREAASRRARHAAVQDALLARAAAAGEWRAYALLVQPKPAVPARTGGGTGSGAPRLPRLPGGQAHTDETKPTLTACDRGRPRRDTGDREYAAALRNQARKAARAPKVKPVAGMRTPSGAYVSRDDD